MVDKTSEAEQSTPDSYCEHKLKSQDGHDDWFMEFAQAKGINIYIKQRWPPLAIILLGSPMNLYSVGSPMI